MTKKLVKASTLAKEYGFAPSTARQWCQDGHWPAVKVGGQWYVDMELLVATLATGREDER